MAGPWCGASFGMASSTSTKTWRRGPAWNLRQTVLEETAHYLTGSKDETRDLQDWAFKFAVRVAMAQAEQCV